MDTNQSSQRGGSLRRYVVIFLLGGVFFFGVEGAWNYVHSCHEHFDLVNPSLLCFQNNALYRNELDYEPLRDDIIQQIAALKAAKKVENISVYFRDLQNGPRFGVQENVTYDAASLMKVPAMVSILHIADARPNFLDERLTSPASFPSGMSNVDQPSQTIFPNASYTVRELMEKMIKYSDNLSAAVLSDQIINNLRFDEVPDTFQDLGMMRMLNGKLGELSLQSYASLFAILYNTWYLSDSMSQYALSLLSQSTFPDGIVAGVPKTIRVAHKFGTFQTDKHSELHDCGIVYHPQTPYVLCIMTSGFNVNDEAASIAQISRTVYSDVDSIQQRSFAAESSVLK